MLRVHSHYVLNLKWTIGLYTFTPVSKFATGPQWCVKTHHTRAHTCTFVLFFPIAPLYIDPAETREDTLISHTYHLSFNPSCVGTPESFPIAMACSTMDNALGTAPICRRICADQSMFSAAFKAAWNTPPPNGARHDSRLYYFPCTTHRRRQAPTCPI